MVYENMSKLKDEHFDLLERIYGMDKNALLALPEDDLDDLLFEDNAPLWDEMENFDENNEPFPDTLLAEQIYDILLPPEIYHP